MKTPERLESLVDQGVITEVIRPLMSGKEADVFLVHADGESRVAKVYKEATQRSFKHRSQYTEGRRVRNSRRQRAMDKRSKFGRAESEAAWQTAEVDVIYRLHAANVRVPRPYDFVDGVLVMELIADAAGEPAPRLVDVEFSAEEAEQIFRVLIQDVVRALCAGVVHGDLSDFNVLITPSGPVMIDFPQAVDPAFNRNARQLLIRDVDNLTRFLGRFCPKLKRTRYGAEMWALYEKSELTPTTRLTGRAPKAGKQANTTSLLEEIEAAQRAHLAKREALGLPPPRPARQPKMSVGPVPRPVGTDEPPKKKSRRRKNKGGSPAAPVKTSSPRPKNSRATARRAPSTPRPKDTSADRPDPFFDLDALLEVE